jgi:hypothetical protein
MMYVNDPDQVDAADLRRGMHTAAANLEACAEELTGAIAAVRFSFDSPSTRGAACSTILVRKLQRLEELKGFCVSAADFLESLAARMDHELLSPHGARRLMRVAQEISRQLNQEACDCAKVLAGMLQGRRCQQSMI